MVSSYKTQYLVVRNAQKRFILYSFVDLFNRTLCRFLDKYRQLSIASYSFVQRCLEVWTPVVPVFFVCLFYHNNALCEPHRRRLLLFIYKILFMFVVLRIHQYTQNV